MNLSGLGVLVTFQMPFTELFVAATVIAAAYRFGGPRDVLLQAAILLISAVKVRLHSYGAGKRNSSVVTTNPRQIERPLSHACA